MTETHDLVGRLLAAIERRETAACAASPGPWAANAEHDEVVAVDGITVAEGFALSGNQLRATVDFIVDNDPTAVLRHCASERETIKDWQEADADIGNDSGNAGFARGLYRALERLAEGYDLAEQQGNQP